MALTARTWVEGEVATASKLNTIRDDLLELDAVAGFNDTQYGTIIMGSGQNTGSASISAVSSRAAVQFLGFRTDANSTELPQAIPSVTKASATSISAQRAGTNGTTVAVFCVVDSRG